MNPFHLGVIKADEKLCGRDQEITQLSTHARNATHVVVVSQRRLGKTSLVWRVLDNLSQEGIMPVYCDLLSVTSKENLIEKLAASIARGVGKALPTESFLQTIQHFFTRIIPSIELKPDGVSVSAKIDASAPTHVLLGDIMSSLERYAEKRAAKCLLVLDEFQEITELPENKEIEALLRESLQATRHVSTFFVGSRRRILEEMFTDKRRPLYKMTMLFRLGKIDRELLGRYIVELFAETGKRCPFELAGRIYDEVEGHTYYVQKLSHIVWDMAETEVTDDCVAKSLAELLEADSGDFQTIWTNLGRTEKRVLMALSVEPTSQPYASAYLARYGIAVGAMQNGVKQLIKKDIVEALQSGLYQPTDPLMKRWCRLASSGIRS